MNDFVAKLIPKSSELRLALADLRQSILVSIDTGFYCFRAVESLRHKFFEETDSSDEESWKRFRDSLNIDREYFKLLEKYGGDQRHGKTPYMSWKDREECMKRAWQIVDRFCIYLKDGETSLNKKDFPILK